MRTTLVINEKLFKMAKERAARLGVSLSQLVEDSLWAMLHGPKAPRKSYRLILHTIKGRTLPGVDLSDRKTLYDRMEKRK
jgi:hypothetical protein